MNYTRSDLVNALVNEWEYLCMEDPDPNDATSEEMRNQWVEMTKDQLIEEILTNDDYTLEQFMELYSR